jgi:hypothetical protein
MLKCGREDYWLGNTYYCRTVACPRCRAIEIGKHQRRLKRRYAAAENSRMLMLTICFDPVATPDEIGAAWVRARKQLAYVVERNRKRSRRWNSFDMSAILEVLPFTLDDLPLTPHHQEMFASMGTPRPQYEGGPLWMAHIHAIVHAPDLDWQEVRDAFAERFSHPHQVDAEPLYDTQSKDDNIEGIVFYAMKYEPGRLLESNRLVWPLSWMIEYYRWAYSFSRSYQSFKFSIGAKKKLRAVDVLKEFSGECKEDSFSSFAILYTDSGAPSEVDLPLDHAAPASAYQRWELEEWCRIECRSPWKRQWLTRDKLARFHFADVGEAVAFKLRFSDLLSGGP